MYTDILPAGTSEGFGSPGTGVTDSSELPCGCWKLNPFLSHIGPNPQGTKLCETVTYL